jgi:transaldolase
MATTQSPERNAAATGAGNPLREIEKLGQAVWLDYIRRNLLTSGELKRMVEHDGISGVTSNPTIFEKAISGGSEYDEQIRRELMANAGISTADLYEKIAVADIQAAADTLRPVYDRVTGADGYISMEVSPKLANETEGSIEEARRLWKEINRPNLLIKIPATPAGIPAIETLLAEGINVNITLIFSMGHYEDVAQAYLRGVARAPQSARIGSVASFFVSRVDTMVDPKLQAIGTPEALALRGKIAVANSRVVYKRYQEIFEGADFAPLRRRQVRVQRVLWASTSTKNPAYPDTLYVDDLIGPDTVNTMPPETVKAFLDHGHVRGATVTTGLSEAVAQLNALKKVGVDLDAVTRQLQIDGVASFSKSYDDLLSALEKKRGEIGRA